MSFNLLDSILSSMNAPPPKSEEQIAQNKYEKNAQQMKKDTLTKFRKKVEQQTADFIRKADKPFIEFLPMDRIYRNIIYDVADVAGLMACSFGEDEVDRYTVLYTKDAGPSEDERHCRNNGGQWNALVAAEMETVRQRKKQIEFAASLCPDSETVTCQPSEFKKEERNRKKFKPNGTHYGEKYNNLSIEPQKTCTNDTYGEVPSRLKRDHRSIEQTMMDIKAKRSKNAPPSSSHTSSDDHHQHSDSSI